ncbi:MAG: ankyrin repeat domain-containing protein [Gammaproteobacteria bacterium WSBS_2016_MAG_OTU1]
MAKVLLDNEANVDATNKEESTALIVAALLGHGKVVKYC